MTREKKGFTLVEVLVVIGIMSVIGLIILTIFVRTLRGSNKAQIISGIKQNGQSILETMDKTIRNSNNVVCPAISPTENVPSANTLVVLQDGIYTRFRFTPPSPPPQAVNGFIERDNPEKQTLAGTSPPREETDPEFVNRVCQPADPMSEPVTLTDSNPQTGVSVEAKIGKQYIFTRDRAAGFLDQVTISFDLKPGVGALEAIAGQIDPVSFETTIQLR